MSDGQAIEMLLARIDAVRDQVKCSDVAEVEAWLAERQVMLEQLQTQELSKLAPAARRHLEAKLRQVIADDDVLRQRLCKDLLAFSDRFRGVTVAREAVRGYREAAVDDAPGVLRRA